jgi:hypothetical protein
MNSEPEMFVRNPRPFGDKGKSSQMIEEGTFIFTDYEARVDEALKSYSAQINSTQAITVTRIGGAVILNGHHVRATDHRQEVLEIGNQYLLYLRLIPTTNSFRAFAGPGSEVRVKYLDQRSSKRF